MGNNYPWESRNLLIKKEDPGRNGNKKDQYMNQTREPNSTTENVNFETKSWFYKTVLRRT